MKENLCERGDDAEMISSRDYGIKPDDSMAYARRTWVEMTCVWWKVVGIQLIKKSSIYQLVVVGQFR